MAKFPAQKTLQEVRNRLNKSMASRPLPKNANTVDQIKFRICEKFVYKNSRNYSPPGVMG